MTQNQPTEATETPRTRRLRIAALAGVALAVALSIYIAIPAMVGASYEQMLDQWTQSSQGGN